MWDSVRLLGRVRLDRGRAPIVHAMRGGRVREEFTREELIEIRSACLDASHHWGKQGNEYAEQKAIALYDKVHSVIVARHVVTV